MQPEFTLLEAIEIARVRAFAALLAAAVPMAALVLYTAMHRQWSTRYLLAAYTLVALTSLGAATLAHERSLPGDGGEPISQAQLCKTLAERLAETYPARTNAARTNAAQINSVQMNSVQTTSVEMDSPRTRPALARVERFIQYCSPAPETVRSILVPIPDPGR